jgi:hypothetical protein
VGGTGLEPVTPSLSNWSSDHDARQRTTTNARSHAGSRGINSLGTAWLRRRFRGRLGQEWATSGMAEIGADQVAQPLTRVRDLIALVVQLLSHVVWRPL